MKLYLQELVDVSTVALTSQSWPMKAQGAAALAAVATHLGGDLGPPHLGTLLTALLDALAGRTWTGKVRCSISLYTCVHCCIVGALIQ